MHVVWLAVMKQFSIYSWKGHNAAGRKNLRLFQFSFAIDQNLFISYKCELKGFNLVVLSEPRKDEPNKKQKRESE